ncbi:hypothetical protein AaE_013676, partial [Aphanomyces astaci]
NCGAKTKWSAEVIDAAIKSVPFHKRQTTRALAFHSGVPRSTILRHMKRNRRLRCKSSYLRPLLTEDNKEERMKFALSFVKKNHVFDDMHDVVHVDEKWFFLTKNKGKFYVYDDETLPHRQSKSKRFITNNVPLCCCAAPVRCKHPPHVRREDRDVALCCQGASTTQQQESTSGDDAHRAPKRDRQSVPRHVAHPSNPAIKMKLPLVMKSSTVYIQQDNAGPHAKSVNKAIDQLAVNDGWTIRLRNQPPNSPDFNVLDLGFFNKSSVSVNSIEYR